MCLKPEFLNSVLHSKQQSKQQQQQGKRSSTSASLISPSLKSLSAPLSQLPLPPLLPAPAFFSSSCSSSSTAKVPISISSRHSVAHVSSIAVITIDGPTASGKGTIGKLLAKKLQWNFLDSGILYRALAFLALENNLCPSAHHSHLLQELAMTLDVEIMTASDADKLHRVIVRNRDVTNAIRQEQCGAYASKLAVLPEVRHALTGSYQKLRRAPGLVADGRDMGTVVFPDAILKIFLTASAEARAQRRWQQLQSLGIDASLRAVAAGLNERDKRDSTRHVAPLRPAIDAEIIDTTNLGVDDVLRVLCKKIAQMFALSS